MRWQMGRRSDNIEDQRGMPVGRGAVVGGGIGTVVLVLLALWFGVDPSVVLQGADPGDSRSAPSAPQQRAPAGDEPLRDFVSVILADTEDTWTELFRQMGRQYQAPHLVLFSGAIKSACGFAEAAVGPFYCPGDRKVYIDLSFYRDLRDKIGAPGDFAQAYVIAHEVGHHVQTLLGISERTQAARQRASETEANAISVRQELQADCFAGIWAHHARTSQNIQLEPGDIEEGMGAAAAVGDDRLQRQAQGTVVPESFTHGSSAQRVEWFRRGFDSGDVGACETFS